VANKTEYAKVILGVEVPVDPKKSGSETYTAVVLLRPRGPWGPGLERSGAIDQQYLLTLPGRRIDQGREGKFVVADVLAGFGLHVQPEDLAHAFSCQYDGKRHQVFRAARAVGRLNISPSQEWDFLSFYDTRVDNPERLLWHWSRVDWDVADRPKQPVLEHGLSLEGFLLQEQQEGRTLPVTEGLRVHDSWYSGFLERMREQQV